MRDEKLKKELKEIIDNWALEHNISFEEALNILKGVYGKRKF